MRNMRELEGFPMNIPNRWFIFHGNELLLLKKQADFFLPDYHDIPYLHKTIPYFYSLGLSNGMHCFCTETLSSYPENPGIQFFPLRQAFDALEHQWFSMVTKGINIINWYKNHQYCGGCGKKTRLEKTSFQADCESCKKVFYPRISPSIIVLIKNKNQLLMARGEHHAKGVYGLIAGFVSPGETVEEAVNREVMEEVGITVKNIRYFGSQPWPFPDSLMLAFTADYDQGEIQIDNVEIKEAGWYSKDNLPGMPSSSKSIAKALIEHFLAEN